MSYYGNITLHSVRSDKNGNHFYFTLSVTSLPTLHKDVEILSRVLIKHEPTDVDVDSEYDEKKGKIVAYHTGVNFNVPHTDIANVVGRLKEAGVWFK